jgi:hypothetical protein
VEVSVAETSPGPLYESTGVLACVAQQHASSSSTLKLLMFAPTTIFNFF